MGYQIKYSPEKQNRYPQNFNQNKNKKIVALGFLAAVFFLFLLWMREAPAGFLLPTNADQFTEATSSLVERIRSGSSVGEAITSFCMEIVSDGLHPE